MTHLRKLFHLGLVFCLLLSGGAGVVPSSAYAAGVPISAPSAVLMDSATKQLVYSKSPNLRRAPASTTKIMTAIVALDTLALDEIVRIPSFVKSIQPSKAHLQPGERYSVRDLLLATLISSANDAAQVLGVAAGGSQAGFAAKMNAKARSLGCERTHFVNPTGLPASGQYSTAYDMALIMSAASRYSFIVETMKIRVKVIRSVKGRQIYIRNHNKMLWSRSGIIGKTGWTRTAQHCFVGTIQSGGRKVHVSLLGSRKKIWDDLQRLANYQFGGRSETSTKSVSKFSARDTWRVKKALRKAGFSPDSISGKWGKRSIKAVKSFQIHHGIQPTGHVGPKTLEALGYYA